MRREGKKRGREGGRRRRRRRRRRKEEKRKKRRNAIKEFRSDERTLVKSSQQLLGQCVLLNIDL